MTEGSEKVQADIERVIAKFELENDYDVEKCHMSLRNFAIRNASNDTIKLNFAEKSWLRVAPPGHNDKSSKLLCVKFLDPLAELGF